jgi:UPF0716 protein FxsA
VDGARFVARFLDRDFVVRALFLVLLYSLLPIAEIVLIITIGGVIGQYLTLAIAAFTGLLGVMVAVRQVGRVQEATRRKIRSGVYPGPEFVEMAGILAGSLLLVTPGFITDAMGLLMLVPAIRRAVGRAITRRLERHLVEVYEYLRLYDL